ncbi:hypothetical protein QUF74_17095 [Candidatus Halobeggiatoa sp. HSG11]|nr:hypothetical protein [Candidatus Halobeggiatoa sp. HSG11]
MMSTNKKLAMAVTAALFSLSATQVVFAAGLTNVGDPSTATGFTATDSTGATFDANDLVNMGTSNTDEDGIKYATELFGGSGPSQLPSTYSAAVIYQIDGAISDDFYLTFTLSDGASFASTPTLFGDANVATGIGGGTNLPAGTLIGNDEVQFIVDVDSNIAASSSFLLQYELVNITGLSKSGNKIEMSVSPTSVGQTAYAVNVEDTVTIAQSAQAVTVELNSIKTTNAEISTELESKEFVVTPAADADDDEAVFVGSKEVRLGELVITHDLTALDDVVSDVAGAQVPFTLGLSANGGGIESATITITEGQFAASITDPGEVKLVSIDDSGSPDVATDITGTTEVSEDGLTATIDVTDVIDELIDANAAASDNEQTSQIRLLLDGATSVNIPENAPCATFTVDYTDENVVDISQENCTVLPKIPQDGTVCTVNIVPKSDTSDALSILITNKSNDEAQLFGSLYGQDGTEIFSSQPLVDSTGADTLGAKKTMRLGTSDLLAIDGATTWTGRGMLKVSTTLDIEILALIRDVASNINSNTSTGANGASCN